MPLWAGGPELRGTKVVGASVAPQPPNVHVLATDKPSEPVPYRDGWRLCWECGVKDVDRTSPDTCFVPYPDRNRPLPHRGRPTRPTPFRPGRPHRTRTWLYATVGVPFEYLQALPKSSVDARIRSVASSEERLESQLPPRSQLTSVSARTRPRTRRTGGTVA